MSSLEGKVAFITGVARGQGRSHAVRLAREGARIIGVDICRQVDTVKYPTATPDDLEETRRLVEGEGSESVLLEADVRDRPGLQAALDQGLDAYGRLDIVVANAGIANYAPFHEISEGAWKDMIDINLTGVWNTCVVVRPAMVESRGGSIIITSSAAVQKTQENLTHYAAAKHGTIGIMRTVAKELAPYMIRVNSIHPTQVDTTMVLNDEIYKMFRPDLESPGPDDIVEPSTELNLMEIPWVSVDDVSDTVVFLASPQSKYITGMMISIDGGYHIK